MPLSSSLTLTLALADLDTPDQNAPTTDWSLTIFPWTSAGRYPHSFDPSPPYWTQIPFILLEGTTHILGLDTLDIPGNVLENLYYLLSAQLWTDRLFPLSYWILGSRSEVGGATRSLSLLLYTRGHCSSLFGQQDLKDFVRPAGEVTYADVDRNGRG